MRHVRSLMLCAPKSLLLDIDGFPVGETYRDAVAAEIGISQHAQMHGYPVRQAALLPYTFIIHPQWMTERIEARTLVGVGRSLLRWLLPGSVRLSLRTTLRRRSQPVKSVASSDAG